MLTKETGNVCSRFVQGVGFESAESVLPLKILLDAELIERRVAGTWYYYRLCTDLEGWLKKECKELLKEATIN